MFLFEVASGLLKSLAISGLPAPAGVLSADRGLIGRAFRQAKAVHGFVPARPAPPDAGDHHREARLLAAPILFDGRPRGAVAVWSHTGHGLGDTDAHTLQDVATRLAAPLQVALLNEQARRRARMYEGLHEMAVSSGGVLTPEELAAIAVERAREVLGARQADVWWLSQSGEILDRLAPADGEATARERRLAERAHRTKRPAWLRESSAGVCGLALPLRVGTRCAGVLAVWTVAGRFDPEEVEIMTLFAAQLAPAMDAAHVAAESAWRARTFAALHEVSVAAGGVLDPISLAALVAGRARDLMNADSAALVWWDPELGSLRVLADNAQGWGTLDPLPVEHGAVGEAFTTGRSVVMENYAELAAAFPPAVEAGIRSVAAVPLKSGDGSLGALVVRSRQPGYFGAERLLAMSLLAAQVAPAVESTRVIAERERQARAKAALRDLAVAAGGVLEPAELARLAVDRAMSLIGFDRVALYWWDHESGQLQSLATTGALGSRRLRPGQGAAGAAFQAVAPVHIEDYPAWEPGTAWMKRRGFQSALAAPLLVNDRAVGSIAAYSLRRRSFTAEEVGLLSLLAAQVAPSLEAARLHTGLARSEERFRSLYETLASGIIVLDSRGRVTDANRAAEEFLGLGVKQMHGRLGESLWQSVAEGDGPDRPELVALRSGLPVRHALVQVTRRDGEVRWAQIDSIPVLDPRGGIEQVVSSLIDVSERRRAEAALQASEGRFRTVFDRAAVGIARIDLDGQILEANQALASMLDRSTNELSGMAITEVIEPDDLDRDGHRRLAAGAIGELQYEMRCRRGDGVLMWGRAIATLVRDERQRPAYVIAMVEDITEQKRQDEALAHRAMHDALTDLPNRTLLFDRLSQGIQLSQREGESLALLMLDLNGFKEVNDTFKSHHVGDMLLRAVADRLRGQLRASDTVARLGGDEFAVVLMAVDGELGAAHAASKLLEAFEAAFVVEGRQLQVGTSIGIALYPEHGEDADTLMRRADAAMYAAKRAGSGLAVHLIAPEGAGADPASLAAELGEALAGGRLHVRYRPRVAVRTLAISSVEALAHWRHPDHGLLRPEELLPAAELAGALRALEDWVLAQSLDQADAWAADGVDIGLAVSLSAAALRDSRLVATLEEHLGSHRFPPRRLQLEITETTLMASPQQALGVLRRLRNLGVALAVDEFGTGYASIDFLRQLPVDEIKIDRALVADMAYEKDSAAIVASTIELAHSLGLRVVAPGVEDHRVWRMLEEVGCDLVQGSLFASPGDASQIGRRLTRPLASTSP